MAKVQVNQLQLMITEVPLFQTVNKILEVLNSKVKDHWIQLKKLFVQVAHGNAWNAKETLIHVLIAEDLLEIKKKIVLALMDILKQICKKIVNNVQ